MTSVAEHPERFDPSDSGGTLMDAEHRCRYWWAAQAVADGGDVLDAGCGTGYGSLILAEAGAKVSGIDLSEEAVEQANARLGSRGSAVQGDLCQLPFDDDSFDLVACFEVIEHVGSGPEVLAEFRRVLRSDGVLLISSPNPRIYPQGNEHHVHEYPPEELRELVGRQFPKLDEQAQHPWVASAIQPVESLADASAAPPLVKRIAAIEPGEQTYTIIAAGSGELPDLGELMVVADAFEVRWFTEQLEAGRAREREHGRELAEAVVRENEAEGRLRDANAQLLRASEELTKLDLLTAHDREMTRRATELSAHYEVAITRLREMEASRVWRLLAPIRRLLAPIRRLLGR